MRLLHCSIELLDIRESQTYSESSDTHTNTLSVSFYRNGLCSCSSKIESVYTFLEHAG
jgi:hypothetical protein